MLRLVPLEDHRCIQKAESQNDGLAECVHYWTLVVDKNVKWAVAFEWHNRCTSWESKLDKRADWSWWVYITCDVLVSWKFFFEYTTPFSWHNCLLISPDGWAQWNVLVHCKYLHELLQRCDSITVFCERDNRCAWSEGKRWCLVAGCSMLSNAWKCKRGEASNA